MKSIDIDEIKKKAIPILKNEEVIRAALFGSVARGTVQEGVILIF